ncbi:killer cell lectin-like receptor 5 [Talpa occidentalis]|uniref:killer cell lectin-like receptor 5 n=1 Tax=Talpa occidentalis TaxID=50954 RepID=UPI0023FA01BA|nr:killer cell lectin-like receptor 5 [Talpa occidentalis]
MSDQEVIYSTVRVLQSLSGSQNHRLSPDGAQRPGKAGDKEMSDQEMIYSTVRVLQSPSGSQNHRLSPDGAQRPGKAGDKECSVSWHLTAVTLGLLCLLLLMTVMVLGTKVFQYIQEKHQWEEIRRNLSLKYDLMKNDSYLKEQHLTNKTLEYEILKNETLHQKKKLELCFIENKLCHGKRNPSESLQNTGRWSCYGISCYYFTNESETWRKCKQTCQNYGSSLLKIDDDDELAFIRSHISTGISWIELPYNSQEHKWKRTDNDTPSELHFTILTSSSGIGKCAFLTSTRIDAIECSNTYSCVCEKMMISLLQESTTRKR